MSPLRSTASAACPASWERKRVRVSVHVLNQGLFLPFSDFPHPCWLRAAVP